MSQQIIKDLSKRYTTKKYDASKRISNEDLAIIKEALRLSPSSINSQPWRFIFVESDVARQRLYHTFDHNFQYNQPHVKNASHIVLLAHKPYYSKEDYKKVVDLEVNSGRLAPQDADGKLNNSYAIAEAHTIDNGFNGHWSKAQVYLALGNILHTLARMGIHSTPLEGIDAKLINKEFKPELGDYVCEVGLAMGYALENEDFNIKLPKARFSQDEVIAVI